MTTLHEFEGESAADFDARSRTGYERRLTASGLPEGLWANRTWPETPATVAATAWATGTGPKLGLVLTGPVGVGKTTLAAQAFRHRLLGERGRWRSVPTLMAHLTAGFGTARYEEAVKLLDGTWMLGLDDLDKARPSEVAAERIFAAIDNTIASNKPLIVTTNLSLGQLGQRWPVEWSQPIVSRLVGHCEVVQMAGPDRRLG